MYCLGFYERAQLASMLPESGQAAPDATIVTRLAWDALAALNSGDGAGQDAAAVRAAAARADCYVIALAQFRLSRTAGPVAAGSAERL